jgi:CHAD domain-containing protein
VRFKISKFIDCKASTTDNARNVLPLLVARAIAQGREPMLQDDPQFLHRLRIQLKRIRDTLDLFGPCYGLHRIRFVKVLTRLLRVLGELNDVMTAREVLLKRQLLSPHPKIQSG